MYTQFYTCIHDKPLSNWDAHPSREDDDGPVDFEDMLSYTSYTMKKLIAGFTTTVTWQIRT